jgi:Uma2 family endonuclease
MSTSPQYQPHYTVDDYQLWEGDWELWNGLAVAMTPSPFGLHSRLLIDVGAALKTAIEAVGCDATVLGEIDWIVDQHTVLRPDLLVVCGREPTRHVEETPAVVVEILSEGTRERDLHHKRSIYQQRSVPAYVIVDPDTSCVTALRLDESGKYTELKFSNLLHLEICKRCKIDVNFTNLFR